MITAVGGILTLVLSNGSGKATTLASWATQANQICQDGYDEIRALGIAPDLQSQFGETPITSRIVTRTNARIQALDRSAQDQEKIDQLQALTSQANVAAQNAYNAWRAGDTNSAQNLLSNEQRDAYQSQQLAGQLGANVCAQGP